MTIKYDSGADMWHEYKSQYGEVEAQGICNRYLDMQIFNKEPEEIQFCKELYTAMQEDIIAMPPQKNAIGRKDEKASIINELAEKKKTTAQQSTSKKKRDKRNEL